MPAYPFWLGGVAASLAACCTHPLDLAKVRMQTIQTAANGTKPSTLSTLRLSVTESGLRSIYTGISASIMRQMSYSLVRLGTYERMKHSIMSDSSASSNRTGKLLVAAGVAGGLGGVAGNPADIILVRMTSDSTKPIDKRYNYPNAASGLLSLVRDEGVKGLARGLSANTARAVLMNMSQVGSYDYFKTMLLRKPLPLLDYQLKDSLLLHTIASCLAGTVATTICSPADVIKSRLMSANCDSSPLQIFQQSLRNEGPAFLFKGWTPAFVRLGPNTVLLFVFFEQLKTAWTSLSERPHTPLVDTKPLVEHTQRSTQRKTASATL